MEILLWQVRQAKNMSVSTLSKKSGVSKAEIYNIENGLRIPRLDVFYSLAKALGVTMDELVRDS